MIRWLNGSAMPRPTSRAIKLRTMRVRSSPRCSMNGILSSTLAIPVLPALDEVSERAHPAPGLKAGRDGGAHVTLGFVDGVSERAAASEPGGDGGGERAARAVGVRRIQTRRRVAAKAPAVPEDVGGGVLEVPALDEHVARAERL